MRNYNNYQMAGDELYAGFAKVDITPDYPCGLGGYGKPTARMVTAIAERIYATCIALTQGEETILLYTIDCCAFSMKNQDTMRAALSPALGIDGNKMFFAATHCHSAPADYGHPNVQRYMTDLTGWLLEAAQQALLDRATATVTAGKKQIPGMTFIRHYLTANGTYAGANFGSFKNNPAVAYAGKADDTLGLVEFRRELPKKSILMVNWQGHPDRARQIGFNILSSSYVGPLRDTLSANTGCLVAFFTGADGNQNIDSKLEKDQHHLNWREYGVKMATLIYEAYQEMEPVEGNGIVVTSRICQAEVDHSWDNYVEVAEKIQDIFRNDTRDAANAEAAKYNMTSCYQARAIITRSNMDANVPIQVFAFRVGNIGFISCHYEMFSHSGIYIKENSPFPYTMLLTANNGYLPTADAYDYRCYEADTGLYSKGIAEKLAETMVDMLKELQ